MAFKITQKPTYITRVTVETPNDRGGFDKSSFEAVFRRVDMDEVEELRKLTQKEVLERVLADWRGLEDEHGPLEFSADNVRALLLIPQALLATSEAFWGSIFKAREKN